MLLLQHAASKTSISQDKTDLEDESKSFECKDCDFTANSEHLIGIHKEEHKTDILMEANNSNSSNGSHDLESEEVPPTKFTCPSCLKKFTAGHSLSLHMSGTGQGVKRPYLGHKIILCNTLLWAPGPTLMAPVSFYLTNTLSRVTLYPIYIFSARW